MENFHNARDTSPRPIAWHEALRTRELQKDYMLVGSVHPCAEEKKALPCSYLFRIAFMKTPAI